LVRLRRCCAADIAALLPGRQSGVVAAHFINGIAVAIISLVALAIVATIVSVARNRPRQPVRVHPDRYRVRGRSIRGWQASAIREIRRAGRAHGTRGR
jgi:hypothetical protein